MKIVTTYIAFDDTEFNTEEECLAYEQHDMDLCIEIDECYEFFDKDMNSLPLMYSHNIEEFCDEFDRAYNDCDYMRVNRIPSDEAATLLWNFFGFDMPEKIGLWRYTIYGWEKA